MARELLGIAESAESETVRLAAIRDALDRAGLKAPTQVDLGLAEPKPYERLLAGMAIGITRDESRAQRGFVEPTVHHSLPSAYSGREVIDVEAEPLAESPTDRPHWATDDLPGREGAPGHGSAGNSGSGPGNQLMTVEEANEQLARDARGRNV